MINGTWGPGDFYRVDFENPANEDSNDGAAYLQARAIQEVVATVTSINGVEKVILVGYSMGGVTAAAYVAGDPDHDGMADFYQQDVAKVLSLGSPLGGSGYTLICGASPEIETEANACRDLAIGSVFLAGGQEGEDTALPGFDYRDDVNCNCPDGAMGCSTDQLPGLAEWDWPEETSYFWLVGEIGDGDDCVVDVENQVFACEPDLACEQNTIDAHHSARCDEECTLLQVFDAILEGLDEGDSETKAWSLLWGRSVDGFVTDPGETDPAGMDEDYFELPLDRAERIDVDFTSGLLAVDLLLCEEGQACDPATPGSYLRHDVVGGTSSIAYRTLVETTGAPGEATYLVVKGTAPASDDGLGVPERACDSMVAEIRKPYSLGASLAPRTQVDLTVAPSVLAVGGEALLAIEVTESDGTTPVANMPVDLGPRYGGSYTGCVDLGETCRVETDGQGRAEVLFSALGEGTYIFVAEAPSGGSDAVTVSFGSGQIIASANPDLLEVDFPSTINVEVNDALGNPVGAGVEVDFFATHPGFFSGNGAGMSSPQTLLTDANGETWIRFTGTTGGTANITIQVPQVDSAAVVSVDFENPSSDISVSLGVGFVGATASSATYELEAQVRDMAGDPIPGERVTFTVSSGMLDDEDCITGPTGVCDVRLTVFEEGPVTATAEARGVRTSTSFNGQPGEPQSTEIFPTQVLSTSDEVWGLDFSPDGSTMVAADRDGMVRAWNTSDWSLKWGPVETADDKNVQVDFSPQGTYVLSAHSDGVDIFNASNGSLVCEVSGPNNEKRLLASFVSESMHFATNDFTLFKYSQLCGSQSATHTATDNFEVTAHMDYSPQISRLAAATQGGTLLVFNTSGQLQVSRPITSGNDDGGDVDFNSTGTRLLAVGWRTVKIFNTSSWTFSSLNPQNLDDDHWGAAFLDNDSKVVIGSRGKIEILDAATGASFRVGSIEGSAFEIAWNPLTEELAVGTTTNKIFIFKPLVPPDERDPIVSITSPQDGTEVIEASVTTIGRVDDESALASFTIDGASVPLDGNGGFSHQVDLDPGPNTIVYRAEDIAGNVATAEIQVIRNVDETPPVFLSTGVMPNIGPPGTLFEVSAEVIDGDSGVASVTAQLRDESGDPAAPLLTLSLVSGDLYQGTLDSTAWPDGSYSLDFEAVDTSDMANTTTLIAAEHLSIRPCLALNLVHVGSGADPVAMPAQSPGCAVGHYLVGEAIDVTASPDPGWSIAGWSGTSNDGSSSSVNSLFMPSGEHTVSVTYAPPTCFPLTLSHLGEGVDPVADPSASVGCAEGFYVANEMISLEAMPAVGWAVSLWTGTEDDASTALVNSLLMPAAAHAVEVAYGLLEMSLLVNGGCEDDGTGGDPLAPWTCHGGCTLSWVSSPVDEGAGACLASDLAASWQGPSQQVDPALLENGEIYDASAAILGTAAQQSAQIVIFLQDSTGWAQFIPFGDFQPVAQASYTTIGGSATLSWNGVLLTARFYVQGSQPLDFYADDLRLTPASGLAFHELLVSLAGPGQGTVHSLPAGILCETDCHQAFSAGTVVELVPTPAAGSVFAGWSGACSGTGVCQVEMGSSRSVTASFAAEQPSEELVQNPGCEGTPAPWTCHTGCGIEVVTSPMIEGAGSCRVFDLDAAWQGPSQDLAVAALAPTTYCAGAWVLGSEAFEGELMLYTADDQGAHFDSLSGRVTVGSGAFVFLSGSIDLQWTGQLTAARLYVQGSTEPFYLDDVSFGPCQGAAADEYLVDSGGVLMVPSPGVLANDGTGLSAQLVRQPAHGAVHLGADGSVVYTPAPGFEGVDEFTYQASDGDSFSDIVPVRLLVGLVFADDFESGDFSRWSETAP